MMFKSTVNKMKDCLDEERQNELKLVSSDLMVQKQMKISRSLEVFLSCFYCKV